MAEVAMTSLDPPDSTSTPVDSRPPAKRDTWTSNLDRLATLLSFSAGVDIVLTYPYYHFYEGTAFLLPHLLALALLGVPLLFMGFFLGQFTSSDCVGVFDYYPKFRGVGVVICLLIVITLPYLTLINGYPLIYLVHTFSDVTKWNSCDNSWNTPNCDDSSRNFESGIIRNTTSSPGSEFFQRNILKMNVEDHILWPQSVASLVVCILVFASLTFGIRSLGKVSRATLVASVVLSTLLFFRAITLPGAGEGVSWFFSPNFSSLAYFHQWKDAFRQMVFTYGLGYGVYITLGSYNDFRNNFVVDTLVMVSFKTVFSLFLGMTIFALLGFRAHAQGVSLGRDFGGGIYLAYASLPEAFTLMNQSVFWATAFFSLLFFLQIDTLMVLMQVVVQCIRNFFAKLRNKQMAVLLVSCVLNFLFSLSFCSARGITRLQVIDGYVTYTVILAICVFEIIAFGFVYGAGRLSRDIQMLSNISVSYYCYFTWLFTTPLSLLMVFYDIVSTSLSLSAIIGFAIAICIVLIIPVYGLCYILRGHCSQKYKGEKAEPWGPRDEDDRAAWNDFCTRHRTRGALCHHTF